MFKKVISFYLIADTFKHVFLDIKCIQKEIWFWIITIGAMFRLLHIYASFYIDSIILFNTLVRFILLVCVGDI